MVHPPLLLYDVKLHDSGPTHGAPKVHCHEKAFVLQANFVWRCAKHERLSSYYRISFFPFLFFFPFCTKTKQTFSFSSFCLILFSIEMCRHTSQMPYTLTNVTSKHHFVFFFQMNAKLCCHHIFLKSVLYSETHPWGVSTLIQSFQKKKKLISF